jgi:gamma-glutamyltranspeptidase/glutathione hydrolase
MKRIVLCFVVINILCIECYPQQKAALSEEFYPFHYKINKTVSGKHGAVVSAHALGSKAGLLMLNKGGNAMDAAIATQLALAVVYPSAGNLGGGGFLVAHLKNEKNITLDFRETAPAKASRDMYLDSAGNVRANLSVDGHLAVGIPGTVAGIFSSLKYAKLSIKTLIGPAIELAEKGYVITELEARGLNSNQASFLQNNTMKPAFIKPSGWKAGDTLIQKDLAFTLKRIRDYGQKGFYEGETARLIAAEMKRGKGIISLADLKNYKAKEKPPVEFPYKGYSIVTMPLPSSGGVLLPMMMKMISKFPIASYGFHSVKAIQLMTEVERLAYADRAKYLGDVDFVKVPVKTLTSDRYIDERMKLFDSTKAGTSSNAESTLTLPEHEETTHISIYDKEGNAVSVTTTLNGSYGSKTVVGGAGFLLNNEMDDFSVKPGVPNMYGAVGGEANAIAPGKRMLSSMTPVIVLKNGHVYIVAGTPGGTTITTSVFQTLVNILEFKLPAEEAVNAPKFHHQWLPDELYVEPGFPADVLSRLKAMGYTITVRAAIGRTEVIKINEDKTIEAVADKRGDDSAEAY